MKYLPTIAAGIALAMVLGIDPTGADEITMLDCENDYIKADWGSNECQALLVIEAIEAEKGHNYYDDQYDEWER